MKLSIVLCSLLLIGIAGFWLFGTQSNKASDDTELRAEPLSETSGDLDPRMLIESQLEEETVVVSEVVLSEPGFLVVREIIGDTAGQIVEISSYLDSGTYSNIEIPLGEFYSGANELMVLLYEDAGSDQVLNDLDQPFVDGSGDYVARFVTTGEVVPNTVIEAKPAGISLESMGMNAETITYTNEGFEPAALEVRIGAMIHFVNESDTQMWVASDSHPAHDILPTFDQFKPGDMFMYVFEEPGTWEYHDHLNPTAVGTITVEAN